MLVCCAGIHYAYMSTNKQQVDISNDGPVTIVLDSPPKTATEEEASTA
jgi:hypothetical protein